MILQEYFKTPIWVEQKSEWLQEVNKACDPHIKEAKKRNADKIKKQKNDFAIVHHSGPIATDPNLKFFIEYIGQKSVDFLDFMGFDLSQHTCVFTECWVQEFPKAGGGNHNTHVHCNNHVSGFYYLKCSDKSSYPVFHDPRPAAAMLRLPEKDPNKITYANEGVHWKPTPGTLIVAPAFVPHEYVVQKGDPFRFIHFNIQAIPNAFKGVQ
jgi:uncharacterized protein (TIGR02466 family)